MAGDVSNGIQGQQFDQTRYGDSLDTLDPVVLLLLGGGGHPVDGVLPLHHLQQRRVRVRFHTKKYSILLLINQNHKLPLTFI